MKSDNELVDHILEPLVPLSSSIGVAALLSWLGGRLSMSSRLSSRLTAAAAAGGQILEHGRGVAGQHLLEAACKINIGGYEL